MERLPVGWLKPALNKISGDWEDEALAKLLEELDQSQSFDATVSDLV